MSFDLPGGSLELKTAIERYLRRILSFPFRLWRAAAAELPAAADYEGGIVWDATVGRLGVSD